MAITSEMIREELEATGKELQKARKKREEAVQHEVRMQRRHDALRELLSNTGGAQQEAVLPTPDAPTEKEPVNKTDMIHKIITNSGARGASPVDIWNAVQKSNTQMHRNYVYAVLDRLRAGGRVVERNGKYFTEAVQ
jgi:hypothetical protein